MELFEAMHVLSESKAFSCDTLRGLSEKFSISMQGKTENEHQLEILTRLHSKMIEFKAKIEEMLSECKRIQQKSLFVGNEAKQFEASCTHLIQKIHQLKMFEAAIRAKLMYFDEMERFQQVLNRSLVYSGATDSAKESLEQWRQQLKQKFFGEQLEQLDQSIQFLYKLKEGELVK